jgi:hypothetical protein
VHGEARRGGAGVAANVRRVGIPEIYLDVLQACSDGTVFCAVFLTDCQGAQWRAFQKVKADDPQWYADSLARSMDAIMDVANEI